MARNIIGAYQTTRRLYFEKYIVNETYFKLKKDFHLISNQHFNDFNSGQSLLRRFGGFPNFLVLCYPAFKWNFLYSERTQKDYWNEPQAEKYFLESVALELPSPITKFFDWKWIDHEAMRQYHGGSLLQKCSNIVRILDRNFPEYFWLRLEKFPGCWEIERRRLFLDRFILYSFYYVETENDLKRITKLQLRKKPGGSTILKYYSGRPQLVFNKSYPELNTKFRNSKQNFIHHAMQIHNIKKKEDWYRLSTDQFSIVSGKTDVRKRNMVKLLENCLPEEDWKYDRFSDSMNKKSRQRFLGLKLQEILKNEVIHEEFKLYHDNLVFVFDFYIPGVKLVVEYQGEQHYYTILKWWTLEEQLKRDQLKIKICSDHGLRLVHVPFWWNNTSDSLLEILQLH